MIGLGYRQDHIVVLNFAAALGGPARREHHHRPTNLQQKHAHPALPPSRGHEHMYARRGQSRKG